VFGSSPGTHHAGSAISFAPLAEESWSIVLAGGTGTRMRSAIREWLGEDRPKQYCTFVGSRSMLQHTVDRASQLVGLERILTVVGPGQRAYLGGASGSPGAGRVLEQPVARGTGPGVFLAATYVAERDPHATVLIFPSDHFVHPEDRFVRLAEAARAIVERAPHRLVLLGARPEGPETEYGWIVPGPRAVSGSEGAALPVREFVEKPDRRTAARLLRAGGLWNTLVVAVRVDTLWAMGLRHLPQMMRRFQTLRQVLRAVRLGWAPPEREASAVAEACAAVPEADFSRDILQRVVESILVLPLRDVTWSDWGRPERIHASLARLGADSPFASPPTS